MSVTRWPIALVVAFILGTSGPTLVLAQAPVTSACPDASKPKVAVYFINGVTTTLDEARLNAGKLELEYIRTVAPLFQKLCAQFLINYNPTSGAVNDFLEASQQRLGIDQASSWRVLEGTGLAALQGPSTVVNQIDQATIQRHATTYQNQIASPSCRRVLLVPHSQGNLYANDSYDRVFTQSSAPPVGTLRIVGVATPASEVKGAVKGSKDSPYSTSTTDVLITAIRGVLPATLSANTNWGISPLLIDPIYSGGHSFIGYLSAEPSRTDVLNKIQSALDALASSNPC